MSNNRANYIGYLCSYTPLISVVLNLEVDCIDQRNFSEGQLKTRLEAFVEMLP